MAPKIQFNCLGFKKEKGFRPIDQLQPSDFHPATSPPEEVTARITGAFISVLGRRELRKAE